MTGHHHVTAQWSAQGCVQDVKLTIVLTKSLAKLVVSLSRILQQFTQVFRDNQPPAPGGDLPVSVDQRVDVRMPDLLSGESLKQADMSHSHILTLPKIAI